MNTTKPILLRRSQRGSALMSSLALVAMSTLLLSGVCVLASSHAARQRREADYALALELADAGVNYELRYISTHLTTSPYGHQSGSAYSGSISGVTGSFSVYVTNTDDSTNWAPPSDVKIVSTGTVGGISRKVTVICQSSGGTTTSTPLFDSTYAVFGYQSILFTTASNAISGNMGVNGPPPAGVPYSIYTQSGGVGNVNSTSAKPLTLAGGATLIPGNSIVPNYTNNPNSIQTLATNVTWPTVDTVVASAISGGWTTLASSSSLAAQWGRIRVFRTQSRSMSLAGTRAITGVTTTSTTLDDTVVKQKADDGQWVNAIILPPGDYYFTSLSLNKNNGYSGPAPVIYFDTNASSTGGTPGPVRVWIGGSGTTNDSINVDLSYTSGLDSDKAKYSRIFYNKAASLTITGNLTYAGVYAVRKGASSSAVSPAKIILTQNSKIFGAVIADNVVMQGGANVTSPSTSMANSTDYSIGTGSGPGTYGFANNWKEVLAPSAGAIFADGTNR